MMQTSEVRQALVVDDNICIRFAAKTLLERLGFVVEMASDGLQAVTYCTGKHYTIVMMDCNMPEMDGLTATRLIREHERQTGQYTFILGYTGTETIEHCVAAGMDGCLLKPASYDTISAAIESLAELAIP